MFSFNLFIKVLDKLELTLNITVSSLRVAKWNGAYREVLDKLELTDAK